VVLTTELVKTTDTSTEVLTTELVETPWTNTEVMTTGLVSTTGSNTEVLTTELVKTPWTSVVRTSVLFPVVFTSSSQNLSVSPRGFYQLCCQNLSGSSRCFN
jgi:hypothetical protein